MSLVRLRSTNHRLEQGELTKIIINNNQQML